MSEDPFSPLSGERSRHTTAKDNAIEWIPLLPVPDDAPPAPDRHPKLGKPSRAWCYRDASERALGFVYRFDLRAGKQFRPLVLFRSATGGSPEWRWESWPSPRPLYGLEKLAASPGAPVVVCEGEKAADAAQRLLPGHVCVTSPNGSKSAAKADWTSLATRQIVLWPDADSAGASYARAVAGLLFGAGAASVAIASPPPGVKDGWDAANAEVERWTPARAAEFIAGGKLAAPAADRPKKEKRKRQRDSLMALCDCVTLWHATGGEGFATIPEPGHHENWPIRSRAFRRWLQWRSYSELGAIPGTQAVEELLGVLEARACAEGPERTPWLRVGRRDGNLYLDLADAAWRVIEIRPNGWDVIAGDGLPFLRSPRMRPLCEPEIGYSIAELRPFVNVASEDDFILVVAWLLGVLQGRDTYPVLLLTSEYGSGKTTMVKRLRSLVDPSEPESQGPPSTERDLVVSAYNSHLIAIDNMSHLSAELGDAIARITSGVGTSCRTLHTDRDETIFAGARPFVLSSIPAVTEQRPDVNSRVLVIHLPSLREEDCRPDDELEADWETARPRALGALCDAVSSALRHIKDVKLRRYGRLSYFEKWVTGAEPGLGWEPGTFSAAYEANRRNAAGAAFEADSVAVAIESLIREDYLTGWEGTATRLLDLLGPKVPETTRRSKTWPTTAQGLGSRIERVKPLLRQRGIIVERKHSGERFITIVPRKESLSAPDATVGAPPRSPEEIDA